MEVLSWHLSERNEKTTQKTSVRTDGLSDAPNTQKECYPSNWKFSMMWKNCHNFHITLLKTKLLKYVTQSVAAGVWVYFTSLNYKGHNTPSERITTCYSTTCLEVLKKTTKNSTAVFSLDPPKHKAGVLTTQMYVYHWLVTIWKVYTHKEECKLLKKLQKLIFKYGTAWYITVVTWWI